MFSFKGIFSVIRLPAIHSQFDERVSFGINDKHIRCPVTVQIIIWISFQKE